MASRGEATEDADGVTEETKEEKDKEEDAIGKSVNIGDKKSLKEKPLSFSMQKLSSKSLFSNLFSCKNVGSNRVCFNLSLSFNFPFASIDKS